MQYVEAVEDMPAPRVYIRNGENPFTMLTDGAFKKRYRFSKEIVGDEIIPLVLPGLGLWHNQRGLPVPVHIKVLTALRFYATGSMQVKNCYVIIFIANVAHLLLIWSKD